MNHLPISSALLLKKKKSKLSKKKSKKKKNNYNNNNNSNHKDNNNKKFSRYDKICFFIALIMFVSTYFYVEIMNTYNDDKTASSLSESSRYKSKQLKKIDGKANNLKRKIVALRKQLKKGLQEENGRKTIQTNHQHDANHIEEEDQEEDLSPKVERRQKEDQDNDGDNNNENDNDDGDYTLKAIRIMKHLDLKDNSQRGKFVFIAYGNNGFLPFFQYVKFSEMIK